MGPVQAGSIVLFLAGGVLASCNSDRSPAGTRGTRPEVESAARSATSLPSLSRELVTPSLGPAPPVYVTGELASARDYVMTLVGVHACEVEPHFRPRQGSVKLGAKVVIEGRSRNEVPVNPLLARLEDSELRDYRADMAGCKPGLPPGRVTAGQRVEGFVSFEVPAAAHGLTLIYTPFVIGMGSQELRFSLGR